MKITFEISTDYKTFEITRNYPSATDYYEQIQRQGGVIIDDKFFPMHRINLIKVLKATN